MVGPGWLCQPKLAPGTATILWTATSIGPLVLRWTLAPVSNFIFTSRGRSTSGPRAVSADTPLDGVARAPPTRADDPSNARPARTRAALRSIRLLLLSQRSPRRLPIFHFHGGLRPVLISARWAPGRLRGTAR